MLLQHKKYIKHDIKKANNRYKLFYKKKWQIKIYKVAEEMAAKY